VQVQCSDWLEVGIVWERGWREATHHGMGTGLPGSEPGYHLVLFSCRTKRRTDKQYHSDDGYTSDPGIIREVGVVCCMSTTKFSKLMLCASSLPRV